MTWNERRDLHLYPQVLHQGAAAYGWVNAAIGVGALGQSIGLSDSILIFAVLSLALTLIVLRKIPQIKDLP